MITIQIKQPNRSSNSQVGATHLLVPVLHCLQHENNCEKFKRDASSIPLCVTFLSFQSNSLDRLGSYTGKTCDAIILEHYSNISQDMYG